MYGNMIILILHKVEAIFPLPLPFGIPSVRILVD